MRRVRRVVTVEKKQTFTRLPDYASEGAVLLQHLEATGCLSEIANRLQIYRQGGYSGLDAAVLFILYFAANLSVGLKKFIERGKSQRRLLGALGGRRFLPTQASISRLLSAVREEDCEEFGPWLLREGAGAREVLEAGAAKARDGQGQPWHVFDLDPTITALRQRALPEGEGLPTGRRRAYEAKPGYLGRKRGDVRLSRTTLQHAGSGLWLGIWTGASKGDWRRHSQAAISLVRTTCEMLGHDPARALIRCDGAAGNTPFIAGCQAAKLAFVTRGWPYKLFDEPEIITHLNQCEWHEVEDSLSGPSRQAAELGWFTLPCSPETVQEDGSPYAPVRCRLVVARYHSENGRGVGRLIEGWKYELFATGLEPQAWSAPQVVTAYYGRTGQENRFAQEDRELELDRIFSYHLPGQHLANLFGLFVWNLRIVRGMLLEAPSSQLPTQARQKTRRVEDPVKLRGAEPQRAGAIDGKPTEVESHAPNQKAIEVDDGGAPGWGVGEEDKSSGNSTIVTPEVKSEPPHECDVIPDPVPESTESIEAAQLRLLEVLNALNWQGLLKRGKGWTFSREAGGLVCPAGHLVPLSSARRYRTGATGQLRFVASQPDCRRCPVRAGCTSSQDPMFHKEKVLTLPASQVREVHTLLNATRPNPRQTESLSRQTESPKKTTTAKVSPVQPERTTFLDAWRRPSSSSGGPLLVPAAAPLLPAVLRHAFSSACTSVEVHVHLGAVPLLPEPVTALAQNPAERQHRRLTWSDREMYNALIPDTPVWIQFLTPDVNLPNKITNGAQLGTQANAP